MLKDELQRQVVVYTSLLPYYLSVLYKICRNYSRGNEKLGLIVSDIGLFCVEAFHLDCCFEHLEGSNLACCCPTLPGTIRVRELSNNGSIEVIAVT